MVRVAVMLGVLAVASCGMTPPEGASCFVDTYTRHDNDLRPVHMVAAANGRWCTFGWQYEYGAGPDTLMGGQVLKAPLAGRARVAQVDGKTRIEYLAPLAYVGPDAFTVEIGRQKVVLNVAVDVHAPAIAATSQAPPTTTTARVAPPAASAETAHSIWYYVDRALTSPPPPELKVGPTPLTQPIGFRCPPQQSVQTFADGGRITWLGTAPGSPDVCIGRNKNGNPVERVRGIWSIGGAWPDAIPTIRAAMAKLTTEPPGVAVPFTVTGQTSQHDDPRPGTWTHTLRILGADDLVLEGVLFSTVLIEDIQTSPDTGKYLAHDLLWVDQASGVVVKSEYDQASPPRHTSWQTVSFKPPT